MRLKAEIRYDADPETVFAMLTEVSFQERKLEAAQSLTYDVEVEVGRAGGARITSRRTLPTDRIPDIVRSALGPTLEIVQVEEWGPGDADGAREGSLAAEVTGVPVRLTGTLRLGPRGGGTLEVVEGDLKARLPLIGGRMERAAEPAVMAAIEAEERTGRTWLGEA